MDTKLNLQIHHTNLFHPKPLGITHIAVDKKCEFIAAIRKPSHKDRKETVPATCVEIYSNEHRGPPRLIHSFNDYDQLTSIDWLTTERLISVSLEQTINIYSIKTGRKIFTTITDYGPILDMKLFTDQKFLVTGTEYGYIATYCLDEEFGSVESNNKMTKINGPIHSLDVCFSLEEVVPNVPTKRKRSSRANIDDDDNDITIEYLGEYAISIYGASKGDVVIWDYHKKSIVETIHVGDEVTVNVVLSLNPREVAFGDSTGSFGVFDTNTFTCRYSMKISDASILCMCKNRKGTEILISGKHPAILTMKRDKTAGDEFRLFEKTETHTHDVTSLVYLNEKKKFFSGSLDGFIVKYQHGKSSLEKVVTTPNFSNMISSNKGEIMFQYYRKLEIWRLPKVDPAEAHSEEINGLKPSKELTLKAKNAIQSSVFNENYITYSGRYGLFVFLRNSGEKPSLVHVDENLGNCSHLLFCEDNFLVACANDDLTLMEIDKSDQDVETPVSCRIVAKYELGSIIQHLVYIESNRKLVVSCGPMENLLYIFDLNPSTETVLNVAQNMNLSSNRISFIATNECEEGSLLMYSGRDQLIKVNTNLIEEAKIMKQLRGTGRIGNLPKDICILGLIAVATNQIILYSSERMFKIDIKANQVVNESSDYGYILRMDNFIFRRLQDIALVELTPDDYRAELPSIKLKKGEFGS